MSYQEKYRNNYLKLNKHFNQKGGQHLNIDYGTTNIGYEAYSSSNLTSVKIPESVTNIGSYAFNINQLSSVKIPDSVIEQSPVNVNKVCRLQAISYTKY